MALAYYPLHADYASIRAEIEKELNEVSLINKKREAQKLIEQAQALLAIHEYSLAIGILPFDEWHYNHHVCLSYFAERVSERDYSH